MVFVGLADPEEAGGQFAVQRLCGGVSGSVQMRAFVVRLMFCVCTLCIHPGFLQGGILLRYSGSTITAGGSGFVDVFVSSDAAVGAPDVLDSFSAHFLIAPVGGAPATGLQFVNPQSDSQLGQSNYVFFGDSLTPPPLGLVSSATNTNDTYIGGDATVSGAGVSLDSGSGEKLLFRLDLSAALATGGSQYTLALLNSGSTSFLDPAFNALTIDSSAFAPITLTAAVPEPSSCCIAAAVLVGFVLRARRRVLTERRIRGLDLARSRRLHLFSLIRRFCVVCNP